MEEAITIRDMLKEMKTGGTFSATVLSYDRKRRSGGQIKHYPELRLYQEGLELGRGLTPAERKPRARKPRHGHHYTRNVVVMQNGTPTSIIRKIHPPLVMRFNGKTVLD